MSLAGLSIDTPDHDPGLVTKFSVSVDEKAVDAIFREVDQCRLPGAAAGITVDGIPVYRKGFGLASMELPVLLTPNTRMRIGSSTKHFTALTWMLLAEEGRVQLDDPIGKYIPELHPVAQKVTARQLMTHVSGLRDAFEISWNFNGTGKRVTCADLLAFYTSIDDVNDAPGRSWIYNNGGYLLLSVAIERVTGKPLEVVMQERLFKPVGMNDTLLRRWDTDFVANSATLHTPNSAGQLEKSYLGTAGVGQGGIMSTVDDMLKWLAHMDNPRVGSQSTWKTMGTPHVLNNGESTGYGLGLRRHRYRGLDIISHSGGVMGGNCQMLKVLAVNLDLIVLLNRSDVFGVSLAEKILDACVKGLDPPAKPASNRLRVGTFQSPRTGRVLLLHTQDQQQIASIDGIDMPVAPDESGVLRPSGIHPSRGQGIVLKDDSAEPVSIELNEFGAVDELKRIRSERRSPAPVGTYVSPTAAIQFSIVENKSDLQMKTSGPSGSTTYDLTPLGEGIWRARLPTMGFPPGGILTLDSDAAGLTFWSFRTRALRFQRSA